jgi:4'-phosphopantetheinyl transferase EntD
LKDKSNNTTIISALFPVEVVTAEMNSGLPLQPVHDEELDLISNAVPKRQREFMAGRICARCALAQLGIEDFPLLRREDRTPVWPPGIVGSIAHAGSYCGVAVAREVDIASVGLDVECYADIKQDLWKQFCKETEISRMLALPSSDRQRLAALIFSAKESVYKCQYPITNQWLGFHDVEILASLGMDDFEARFLKHAGHSFKKNSSLQGKFLFKDDYVFTGLVLTNKDNPGRK